MEQTDKTQATNEELLRKVIEAQVRGGYVKWDTDGRALDIYDGAMVIYQDMREERRPIDSGILEILLDTHGCKAAYGDDDTVATTLWRSGMKSHELIAHRILEAWSRGGNNVRAALETAVSSLPEA